MLTALYGAETWGLKAADKKRLNVMEMKCLRTMCGVTIWDRQTNDTIRRRTGVNLELSYRAEQRGLRWFGHMKRMNDGQIARRVINSMAEGVAARGRPKLGWKEGIKNSLYASYISMEEGRVKALDRKEWRKKVNNR